MNKTVGIVTWIGYPNYGTYLQAFALREIVTRLGFNVGFINDLPLIKGSRISRLRNHPHLNKIASGILFGFIKCASWARHPIWNNICHKQASLYSRFQKKYLPIIEEKSSEILIAGSDQIWSPRKIMNARVMRHYFLANFDVPKIAYAPSLSFPDEFFEEYALMVSPWLSDFAAVSAREPRGAEILSLITNREIPSLLDPTLLLSKEEWIRLLDIHKNKSDDKYCFCYLLTFRKEVMDNIREYAERHNLKIRFVLNDRRLLEAKDIDFMIAGPTEFLSEMAGAECVVTDSFHGTLFSTIFEKPRAIIKRFADTEYNQQNQRIRNVLSLMGSNEALLEPGEPINDNDMNTAPIDWRVRLTPKLNESLNYLKVNLNEFK